MPSINKINDPVGGNREWPEKAVHVWWGGDEKGWVYASIHA